MPPPSVHEMIAWIGGRVVPLREATVPVVDHGFLYGDSAYETLRTFNGGLFRLESHLRRFRATAEGLRIPVPWTDEQLAGWVGDLRRHLGGSEHYVRMILSRGPGELSYAPDPQQHPTLLLLGGPFEATPAARLEAGFTAVTVSVPRSVPNPLRPGLKTGNLLNSRLGFLEAREQGADEALMVNRDGFLAEGANSNVFLVLPGEVLATPSLDSEILEGVTRAVLLELGRSLGLAVREEKLPMSVLAEAEEAFLSSTTRSVGPLCEVDGRRLACPGAVTRRIMEAFSALAGGI